jgi:hypothetical protein
LIKNHITRVDQGSPMKLCGFRHLSLLLIVTLLFCHGVFGSLHLLCHSPQCAGGSEHATEHHAAAGPGGTHDHPAGHAASTGYFAVLAFGFLGLLWGRLSKAAPLRLRLDARRSATLSHVPAVVRPPPTPTPLALQVFRL